MTRYDYLQRHDARIAREALKREIIFGLALSSLLLGLGLWRTLFVLDARDALWSTLAAVGAIGLLLAVVFPAAWIPAERTLSRAAKLIGGWLLSAILAVVYVLLVAPLGWLLRRLKGADPIYAWRESAPRAMEGWRRKEVLFETRVGQTGKPNVARRFLGVLQFFAARGHYVYLPTLVILMSLGLVLFFVKSSALAPFLYTLF
jgi:hypothetical protein